MADVFISYATEDRDRVKALAEALGQAGFSIWWDRKIPLGRAFDQVIEEAIRDAKSVIVVWSAASVASEWVRNEASEGKRRRILVPVFIEPVDAPLAFRLLSGADLNGWAPDRPHGEFDKLKERVAEIIAHMPLQTGGPAPVEQPGARAGRGLAGTIKPIPKSWIALGAVALLALGVIGYALYPRPEPRPVGVPHADPVGASKRSGGLSTADTGPDKPVAGASLPGGHFSQLETALQGLLSSGGLGPSAALPAFHVPDLGLRVVFMSREVADKSGLGGLTASGAVVWEVQGGGPAGRGGLHIMDLIAAIDGKKIDTEDDLRQAFTKLGPGKIRFVVKRGAKELALDVDCPTCKPG